jgi:hypothetical protein
MLFLLLTSLSQASIPAATINSDAAEIYNLSKLLISYSPTVVCESLSVTCEIINECCPSIKPRLAEYVDHTLSEIVRPLLTACIGNKDRQEFLNTCPVIDKFKRMAQHEDFHKYVLATSAAGRKMQHSGISVQRPCSSDEIYASICDWTNRELHESCERKSLLYVEKENGDDDYQTYVRETKSNLRLLIDVVNRTFPIETNSERRSFCTIATPKISSASTQRSIQMFISLVALLNLVSFFWN